MNRLHTSWLVAVAIAGALCGCSDRGTADQPDGSNPGVPAAASQNAPAAQPGEQPNVPLVSSRGVAMPLAAPTDSTAPADGAYNGAGLAFTLPAGWQAVTPASSMRLAQANLPGGGELAVFHFGVGGGGDVESNIARWIGQVEVAAGTEPRRESSQHDGLTISVVEVDGTLLPTGMGTGPTTPQPGSRLLGAVVEGPGGPWFFKATGPAESLAAARAGFLEMLAGARPAGV